MTRITIGAPRDRTPMPRGWALSCNHVVMSVIRGEAVLLTGGSGDRMGIPNAQLMVKGVPLGARMAAELNRTGWLVTVLGQEPIAGYPFLADAKQFAGPLAALRKYQPGCDLVFVAGCDMPLFRQDVVKALVERLEPDADAILPVLDGKPQPLSAIYRKRCFYQLEARPEMERMSDWVAHLKVQRVEDLPFPADWITSVKTPSELQDLLRRDG